MNRKIFMAAVLLTIALFAGVPRILAQQPATLFLQQAAGPAADQIIVDVMISNVVDLYGAEVRLRYDPLILQPLDTNPNQDAIQVEPGPFFPPDKGFVLANSVDEEHGTITFATTLLNPAPPSTGQGVLFKATFQVLRPNESTLNIEHAKLVAHNLETIPNQTQPLSFGMEPPLTEAEVRTEQAQEDDYMWAIAGGLIITLGLGLLTGVVIAMKKETWQK